MANAQTPIVHYQLGMSRPSTHLLEVEMTVDNIPADDRRLEFIMPVWRSGRYVVLDFSGGVQEFSAGDKAGKPLPWMKLDKTTWRVETKGARSVKVTYKVFANEFGLRTRGLNDEHAFLDPASVFLYVEKLKLLPVTLTVVPDGNWHVTTGLEEVQGSKTTFSAPNFEYFSDCPIEVGNQKDFEFEVEGKKHVLMMFGEGNWDEKEIIPDLTEIVKTNKKFWGELPYDRYVFMFHITPSSGGGTEHINSAIMGTRPFVFKNPDNYRGFLGLVSHEFFHTWNVKQLRPVGIHPYDYSRENYVRELWIAEGTTDYYGPIILLRTGFLSLQNYLSRLASTIRGDRSRPGNAIESPVESSFDAWVKYWKNNRQAFNSETDYYDRGANVSLALDMEIRRHSKNKHSLDDVMKTMFQRYRLKDKGYTVENFRSVAEEYAGTSLEKFFDDYVFGTAKLPWEESLAAAGLIMSPKDSVLKPWLGIQTSDVGEKTRVMGSVAGSPAYEAGVDIDDEILALDGIRVRARDLQTRIAEMKAGEKVTLTVFREDKLRQFEITLKDQPIPEYKIEKAKTPTDLQKATFHDWLGLEW